MCEQKNINVEVGVKSGPFASEWTLYHRTAFPTPNKCFLKWKHMNIDWIQEQIIVMSDALKEMEDRRYFEIHRQLL